MFGNAFLQYNTLSRTGGIQFRARYNVVEGRDVFLVLNRDFAPARTEEEPVLGYTSVLAKVVYTLAW